MICAYCGARLDVIRTGGDTDRAGCGRDQQDDDGASMPPKPIGDRGPTAGDGSDRPVSWQVVASFKYVSQWHEAARALSRVGIMARMLDDPTDACYSALAVPAGNVDTARQVLARLGG